ncbi:MAG: hypothetical protein U0R49_09680 [Fimbriimonadales bacterium]
MPSQAAERSVTVTDEARRTDWFGVILGAAVFLGGIALLAFTFLNAFTLFTTPQERLIERTNPEVTRIVSDFSYVILKIGVLLVMSIVGSIISGKGIRMYLAARAGLVTEREKVSP